MDLDSSQRNLEPPAHPKPPPKSVPRPHRSSNKKISGKNESSSNNRPSEDIRLSGLELEDVEPISTVNAPPVSPVISQTAVEISRFDRPTSTFFGAFQYWLHVNNRLKALGAEHQEAKQTAEKNESTTLTEQAELGRKIHQADIDASELKSLIDAALLIEGDAKGMERKRVNQSLEHRTKIEGLRAAIELIERKNADTAARYKKRRHEQQQLVEEKRGLETQNKRLTIDSNNMQKLIAQRKEQLGSPKTVPSEKSQLESDIQKFEHRNMVLQQQLVDLEHELQKLNIPLNACKTDLQSIREALAPEREKISALKQEISNLQTDFGEADRATQTAVHQEAKRATRAWAAVAETAISKQIEIPDTLKKQRNSVIIAMKNAQESTHRAQLLETAMESYDKPTIQKAKKQGLFLVGVVILSIIAIVLFV